MVVISKTVKAIVCTQRFEDNNHTSMFLSGAGVTARTVVQEWLRKYSKSCGRHTFPCAWTRGSPYRTRAFHGELLLLVQHRTVDTDLCGRIFNSWSSISPLLNMLSGSEHSVVAVSFLLFFVAELIFPLNPFHARVGIDLVENKTENPTQP